MRESATQQGVRPVSRVQARAEEMMRKHGFLGVPAATFADAGRRQFSALLDEGLNPKSIVLDVGCGCLRAGYWLVRFLDPGSYQSSQAAIS